METYKIIKLCLTFDLTKYELTREELEVTDLAPFDAMDAMDSWWPLKNGHYTEMGIPKFFYLGDQVRQYRPYQIYEAYCTPDKEQQIIEQMNHAVRMYVSDMNTQLENLMNKLADKWNEGYRIKEPIIHV